jgi:hypothetical protein
MITTSLPPQTQCINTATKHIDDIADNAYLPVVNVAAKGVVGDRRQHCFEVSVHVVVGFDDVLVGAVLYDGFDRRDVERGSGVNQGRLHEEHHEQQKQIGVSTHPFPTIRNVTAQQHAVVRHIAVIRVSLNALPRLDVIHVGQQAEFIVDAVREDVSFWHNGRYFDGILLIWRSDEYVFVVLDNSVGEMIEDATGH